LFYKAFHLDRDKRETGKPNDLLRSRFRVNVPPRGVPQLFEAAIRNLNLTLPHTNPRYRCFTIGEKEESPDSIVQRTT